MRLNTILEMLWTEQYTAMRVAKSYPRDWIHFASIPKLGVNPSKTHRDPPGIYFYPISWLLRIEDDSGPSLSQYATHLPYYYICSIQPSPNLINLNRMTQKQVEKIATRNGWINDLRRIEINPSLLNNDRNPMDKKLLRRPGGFFYACMDYLANIENRPWLKLLAGVDGLVDNGSGIISNGETYQSVIFNRNLLQILKFGENKDQSNSIYSTAVQTVAKEFNGKFFFKNKIPGMQVVVDGKPITLLFNPGNYAIHIEWYNPAGHWMRKTEKYSEGSVGDLDSVIQTLRYQIKHTAESHESWFGPNAKASPKTRHSYWDRENIMKIFNLLMPRATRIRSRPTRTGMEYSVIIDALLYEYLLLSLEGDQVHITAEISTHNHDTIAAIKPEDNFVLSPTTDIEAATTQILDNLADQLRARTKDQLPQLHNRLWFNFGDRFKSSQ